MIVEVGLASIVGIVIMIRDAFTDDEPHRWRSFVRSENTDRTAGPGAWVSTGTGYEPLWCRGCDHAVARNRADGSITGHRGSDCRADDILPYEDGRSLPRKPTAADFPGLARLAERDALVDELVASSPGLTAEEIEFIRANVDLALPVVSES